MPSQVRFVGGTRHEKNLATQHPKASIPGTSHDSTTVNWVTQHLKTSISGTPHDSNAVNLVTQHPKAFIPDTSHDYSYITSWRL